MYKVAHEAALDGVKLGEVDSRIIVLGCGSDAGKDSLTNSGTIGRGGQRITGIGRDYVEATVQFGINMRRGEMNQRGAVFEKAMAWAAAAREQNRWLTFGHKDGRRLRVRLCGLPAEGDPWQWNQGYAITFRACEVPWWQDSEEMSVRRAGVSSLTQQISVNGSARTVMSLSYTNSASSVCNTLNVNTGSAEMHFSSLGIAQGETFRIDHSDDGLLRIRIQNTAGAWRSALGARIPATSDDELWIAPGTPAVTCSAQRSGIWVLGACGRYE